MRRFEVLFVRELPEPRSHFERALAGESSAGEIHVATPDDWFDVSYEPLLRPEGQVSGVSVFAVDITDRVQAGRARDENEARSRVMAVMNHEVRTPLNSVLGFTELLHSERADPLNEKQQRYVANVESAGSHLLALVGDSLDLSKMASGQMEFTIQCPIDPVTALVMLPPRRWSPMGSHRPRVLHQLQASPFTERGWRNWIHWQGICTSG